MFSSVLRNAAGGTAESHLALPLKQDPNAGNIQSSLKARRDFLLVSDSETVVAAQHAVKVSRIVIHNEQKVATELAARGRIGDVPS